MATSLFEKRKILLIPSPSHMQKTDEDEKLTKPCCHSMSMVPCRPCSFPSVSLFSAQNPAVISNKKKYYIESNNLIGSEHNSNILHNTIEGYLAT